MASRIISLCFLLQTLWGPSAWALTSEQQALRDFLKQNIDDASSFEDRFEAEVWLVDMSTRLRPFLPNVKERLTILKSVHRHATQMGLPTDMVLALIEVESHFDRFAVSRAGARGLMQVMPFWKKEIGRPGDNLMDIDTNLRYGCTILKFYLDKEEGRWLEAMARYNGSYGKYWYPKRVMKAWAKRWSTGEAIALE